MSRDFHLPGRSPVIACEGMAATSHPLATLAAIETLRAGGNAADAAVTAVAVLCVVEPHMTGIGGDCFCMVAEPGQPVWGYNGSGRAGAARLDRGAARAGHPRDRANSIHAVTVPGAVDAWAAILAGAWPLRARARARARDPLRRGRLSGRRPHRLATGRRRPASCAPIRARRATTCSAARAPAEGDVIKLPALAQTLKTIAAKGPRAFYEGRSPTTWSRPSRRAARCSPPRISPPIAARWSSRSPPTIAASTSSSCRPTAQGLTALVLLNILERFDLAALDPLGPDRFHLALEAARLAYAVRDTHIADPAHHARAGAGAARQGASPPSSPRRIDRDAPRRRCRARRRRAATPSTSPWSTATAWRCR